MVLQECIFAPIANTLIRHCNIPLRQLFSVVSSTLFIGPSEKSKTASGVRSVMLMIIPVVFIS
jgi:hypothetical protein